MENKTSTNVVLAITTLSSFTTAFSASCVNVALPSIGLELKMNAILLGWIATSFLLSSAVFLIPLGRAADIYGRKKFFMAGISIYIIASLMAALANLPEFLILSRAVQGIGGALIFGTSVAILTSVYPPQYRGRALGINTASVYIGLSAGPFLGGILTHYLGWRSIFLFNAMICLVLLPLIFWKMKGEWADAKGEKLDVAGSLIYALGLFFLMAGFAELPGLTGWLMIAGGITGISLFLFWESKVKSPAFDVRIFAENRAFAFSNLAAMINYSVTFAVAFFISLYLQYVKGMTPQHAGFILVAQPIVQAALSPAAGRLSDRIEPRVLSSLGMLLTALGLFLLIFLNSTTPVVYIVGCLMVLGLGFALFSSPNVNAVMSSVDRKFYGTASATLGTTRLIGQMLSMGIAMILFALIIGKVKISVENSPSFIKAMQTGFCVFTVLCAIGIFASLARGNVRK